MFDYLSRRLVRARASFAKHSRAIAALFRRRRAIFLIGRPGRFIPFLRHEFLRHGYGVVESKKGRLSWLARIALLRKNTILVRDSYVSADLGKGADVVIDMDYDYFSECSPKMPYFMHPALYRTSKLSLVERLANMPRDVRIAFAGTALKETYQRNFVFPMLDRHTIIDTICRKFAAQISYLRTSRAAAHCAGAPIVMCITDDPSNTLKKHALEPREYLRLLAHSRFFISPPGFCMPHSHNIIEAMNLGAIPITNYYDYLVPPLTPGVNCLGFKTQEQLVQVIRLALAMEDAELEKLAAGVALYRKEHLSMAPIFALLEQGDRNQLTLYVNNEVVSVDLVKRRGGECSFDSVDMAPEKAA